jgi:hypothetical protein
MASRRTAVMDAAFSALGAATATDLVTGATYTKPVGLSVYRTHPAPLKAADLPAVVIRRAQEENSRQAGGHKDRRQFLIAVDCFVGAATSGETVEDALDLVTSWAVQAISNTASLQGGRSALAHATHEVLTKWEESDTDAVYGRATIGFSCDYITAAGNPDAA